MLVAPTGSGKTLAYLLAALPFINRERPDEVQVLVVSPTRELALQIEATVKKMAVGLKSVVCYGGHAMQVEKRNFSPTPTIVIGTPGRLVDHLHRDHFKLKQNAVLILDEFDKALEMGFHDDMEFILEQNHPQANIWLCSATESLDLPSFVEPQSFSRLIKESEVQSRLRFLRVYGIRGKRERLYSLLHQIPAEATVVFCNQKDTVNVLVSDMRQRGIDAIAFHGGMEQHRREVSLAKFRNGSATVLVSTDLAARGIDVDELNHVVHYDLPEKEATFTHRNGRTARIARKGTVYMVQNETEIEEFSELDYEDFELQNGAQRRAKPKWQTFFISGGKKNKINKIDLVGFFIQVGRLEKSEIGLIEVKDFASFVAIKSDRAKQVLALCRYEKIKKKKLRIEIAR